MRIRQLITWLEEIEDDLGNVDVYVGNDQYTTNLGVRVVKNNGRAAILRG